MPAVEESDNYICEISPERLPGPLVHTSVRYLIGYEQVEVFKICVEKPKVIENVPEEDVNVKISSDSGGSQRIEYSIEAIEEATL